MTEAEQDRFLAVWLTLPESVRSEPASEQELVAFEAQYGSIPLDFRWFLAVCGGGPVGSEWVDDIAALPSSHDKFRSQSALPGGYIMRDVFIVGWDGYAHPFGIHTPTGELRVEDHHFGGVHVMAESFAHFLLSAFTKSPGTA